MQKYAPKNHNRSKSLDFNDDDDYEIHFDSENPMEAQHLRAHSLEQLEKAEVKCHRRSESLRYHYEFVVNKIVTEAESAERAVIKFCHDAWNVCHFDSLPKWLQDNEYLLKGHRPPLPSYWICIKSIFRLHTETGNIWTHGLGCILFLALAIYILTFAQFKAMDRLMFSIYFTGAITCLLLSTLFHTCSCHSPNVAKIWSKLDYCGISIQIIGSMIPAMYYFFYYNTKMAVIYVTGGVILCALSITVSLWDKFGEPKYRAFRAGVFIAFGLSNIIPGVHWFISMESQLLTFFILSITQGVLYIIGAVLYAMRIPERFLPGKCDYLFQSHQIFHVFVVMAAIVHLNGLYGVAMIRSMDDAVSMKLNS